MQPSLIQAYFGTAKLGSILGFSLGVMMLGAVIGPPLTGRIFDAFGSYQGAWFAYIGVAMVGSISILTTPSTKKDRSP